MAKVSAVVLIYDIRGFTAASKKLATADLGAFATAAHKVILDLFAERPPTFVKNLGDGHLLIWETTPEPERALVQFVTATAQKARTTFPAFVAGRIAEEGGIGNLPTRVGIGVVAGEVSKSDDYYGVVVNLAARLQNMARPEGLALDTKTFDMIGNRETLIEQGFKKDRVSLKGLGSTLVWVDRPFSWERVWQKVWPYLAAIVAVLGYILLADKVRGVPGGPAIQTWLDRHDLSVLRRYADDATIRATAARDRRAITAAMLKARMPDGRIATELPKPVDPKASVWGSSQAICGLLTVPHLDAATKRSIVEPYAKYLFSPGVFIEGYGWRSQVEETRLPYAEPALWTVALLARALGTPTVIADGERPRYMELLRKSQAAVDSAHYRPLDNGGWNIFPNQTAAEQYSPYTTALALHALLEVRAAGLPWRDSTATRDALLAKTAGFLISLYEKRKIETKEEWGWRRTHELSVEMSEGLTMQIYSELLRAESEAGVVLPEVMPRNIATHVIRLIERTADSQNDAGEFIAECTDQHGVKQNANEGINFVWHAWAVDTAVRWLERAKRIPAPHEDIVGVRRALSHLVVTMSEDKTTKSVGGFSFLGGEALIGLSAVPEP